MEERSLLVNIKNQFYTQENAFTFITQKTFSFQAEYSSIFPYFDFDSDMDAWTVARAFAKEPWSKEYFERIRKYVCTYFCLLNNNEK